MNTKTKAQPKTTAAPRASRATAQAQTGFLPAFTAPYAAPKPELTMTQAGFINSVSGLQADALLVGMMANQVEMKMLENRKAGRYGWHTQECSSDQLRVDLKKLVDKGDYIDAAIVSAMLLLRGQLGLN